ncbi:hypothetical protein QE152_g37495 [Popillia japonica]|uniref:Transposase n=1 Tax=Popillia japonica TaxID=7064 RepID=A0AAW1IAM0_POPJA
MHGRTSEQQSSPFWKDTDGNVSNARPHIGAAVVALLERYRWERLNHPPYSPDLTMHGRTSEQQSSPFWKDTDGNVSITHRIRRI